MNSAIGTLRHVATTKTFAFFAITFFLLISLLIVILFSSLSQNPSFENLQSLVLGKQTPVSDTAVESKYVLGSTATSNSPAFVIKTSELEAFLVFITGKLELSETQSAAVIREANQKTANLDSNFIKISFFSTGNTFTIHLEGLNQKESTVAPQITPLPQNPNRIIEVTTN